MRQTDPSFTIAGLVHRIDTLEREVADLRRMGKQDTQREHLASVVFHWPGQVDSFLAVRNGPHTFPQPGMIYLARYVWQTTPGAAVTVKWYRGATLLATHTVTATATYSVPVAWTYNGETLSAEITAAGSTAAGLTAYLDMR